MEKTVLKLDNVSKSFAKIETDDVTHALSSVTTTMESGEFISMVGPSGCGKSTILRLVAGLIQPTTGTITLNGKPIEAPGPDRGMMFQKATLFPWLTVYDNIAFSLKMQGKLKGNEDKVEEMIKTIGLQDFREDYPGQLSGGMAQRVSLGRTLFYNPDIILMDEPFSALDYFTRQGLQQTLLRLYAEERKTIIFVTHDVEEALLLGDRVLIMDSGRVREALPVKLPRPRQAADSEFQLLRQKILQAL